MRIDKRDTAGNSKHFLKKGKDNMSKTRRYSRCGKRGPSMKCPSPRAITAQEALSMLESAVSYCQSAGLSVAAANGDNGTLGLFIPNAHYTLRVTDDGTRAAFRLGAGSVSAQSDTAERNGTRATVSAQVDKPRLCPNCDAPMEKRDDGTLKCTRCYWYLTPQDVSAH